MIKNLKKGMLLAVMFMLAGCSSGSKGQTVPDTAFETLHENYIPEISLSGDFSLTYECKVGHESGTLEESELGFDLLLGGETLHMPMFDAETYLEQEDGTIHEFTDEEKAKGRKEAGSVYSTNKIPSSDVELTITLSRAGDVISGKATYEGGAMGKGDHQFWLYHYYSKTVLPENLVLKVTGQNLSMTNIRYTIE